MCVPSFCVFSRSGRIYRTPCSPDSSFFRLTQTHLWIIIIKPSCLSTLASQPLIGRWSNRLAVLGAVLALSSPCPYTEERRLLTLCSIPDLPTSRRPFTPPSRFHTVPAGWPSTATGLPHQPAAHSHRINILTLQPSSVTVCFGAPTLGT